MTRALHWLGWPAVAHQRPSTVVIPLGSCEQHGPHLPFDVDTTLAEAVAAALARDVADVVVAPGLAYGASGEHQGFPGTLSIGLEATETVVVELGRSATTWCDRVLLLNGHGGNVAALRRAVARLRAEGRDVAWWACAPPGADGHAGHTETSLMLAVRADAVAVDHLPVGATVPLADVMADLVAHGVRAVSPTGVLGDATRATPEEGRALLAALVTRLAADLADWSVGSDGRLGA